MSNTLSYTSELTIRQCWCGINFALPTNLNRLYVERERENVFCPLGHSMIPSQNKVKNLQAQLASTRVAKEHYIEQAASSERRRAAAQGQVTKIRNRVGRGVCPCCNRHFKDLMRHMENKHPKYNNAEATNSKQGERGCRN